VCTKKTCENSNSRWWFTSYPPFYDVSAENSKLIETSSDFLATLQSTYICCVGCAQKKQTQNSISRWRFKSYPHFYDVSAENSKSLETSPDCLSTFQSTYIYCVGCAQKKPTQNSIYTWYFTSNPHFYAFRPKNL
jgi:hypothetical protein